MLSDPLATVCPLVLTAYHLVHYAQHLAPLTCFLKIFLLMPAKDICINFLLCVLIFSGHFFLILVSSERRRPLRDLSLSSIIFSPRGLQNLSHFCISSQILLTEFICLLGNFCIYWLLFPFKSIVFISWDKEYIWIFFLMGEGGYQMTEQKACELTLNSFKII